MERSFFRPSFRTIVITGGEGGAALTVGIYQAIVSFDFGGESLVVGVKGLRVR